MPWPPLRYERAVLAGAALQEQLRTARRTRPRGPYDDVVAHQQAAMSEQLALFGQEQNCPAP